jgi:uncharacterized protein CbrC (UPF0167 family)
MDSRFPTFRFLAAEVAAAQFDASEAPCDCCARTTGLRYHGNIYGHAPDNASVCPSCIADGSVAQRWDASFNQVDPRSPCDDQAKQEAEQRTPGFPSWQELWIPVCCGMPTEFLGDAGWHDLTGRWAEAQSSIFDDGAPGTNAEERQAFLKTLKAGGDPAGYVFRCVTCARLIGRWDCG